MRCLGWERKRSGPQISVPIELQTLVTEKLCTGPVFEAYSLSRNSRANWKLKREEGS